MARVTAKALARSSGFGIGAEVWRILSRLILTPIIISKLGIAGYGTWTVLFSITAQFGIVKVSFGAAYAKLTAEYDSKGDYETLRSVISAGMVIALGFSVVALGVLWLFRVPLLRVMNVPAESLDEAAAALMIVATFVLLQLSAGAVNRALEGLQRLDLVYMLNILGSVIDFCVTLALLTMGYGLLGLAIGFAAGRAVALVLARYFCHRVEPRVGITPFHATREGFAQIGRLGGKFQLLSIMGLLLNEGSKLLVSALLGVSMLGVYEIAHKLIRLGNTVGHAVVGPLMPAFANLHAQESYAERTRSLYMQVSRVLAGATGLCFAFLAVFANEAIVLWTGGAYPLAAWTLRVFAPGMFLQTLTGVGTSSLRARGKVRLELGTAILSAIVTFGSAYPLYRLFGYQGLVLAFVSGSLIGPPWFLTWYSKLDSIDGRTYLKTVIWRPLLALVPPALVCWILSQNVMLPTVHANPRMQALIDLLIWGGLFALMAAVAAWIIVLEPGEREAVSAQRLRLASKRGR